MYGILASVYALRRLLEPLLSHEIKSPYCLFPVKICCLWVSNRDAPQCQCQPKSKASSTGDHHMLGQLVNLGTLGVMERLLSQHRPAQETAKASTKNTCFWQTLLMSLQLASFSENILILDVFSSFVCNKELDTKPFLLWQSLWHCWNDFRDVEERL